MVPTVKAMATERRMPVTISNALSVLMKSHTVSVIWSLEILKRAVATAAPRMPNTRETVVEVGRPNVLKVSRRITSLIITPRNSSITSW